MILDLEQSSTPDRLEASVAIVGSGAVGTLIAVELAERGIDTVLAEAGGTSLESSSQEIFATGRSVGHPLPGLSEGRYRLLGGTTNYWGGQLARFDANMFAPRPWVDAPGWPISRADLDPYYDRALDRMGVKCLRDDAEVWSHLSAGTPDLGDELEVFLSRWLPDPNLARIFRPVIDGDRLRTLIHANVVAIDPAATPGAANRLVVRTMAGRTAEILAPRVILANGTIEIARLLQFPLASGGAAPWHASPWLGRSFSDHIDCTAGEVRPIDKKAFEQIFDNIYIKGYKYAPKLKLSAQTQSESELLQIGAHMLYLSDYGEHLANLKMFVRSLMGGRAPSNLGKLPAHIAAVWKIAIPLVVRYARANRAFNPADRGIKLRLTSEQFPNPESRITLSRERDRLGLPLPEVDWRFDGRELETLGRGAEIIAAKLSERGLATVDLNPRLVARDPGFFDDIDDGYHQMGGARIGSNIQDGVVDADLQLFGTRGIYVAGAAVFPATGFHNPTFTAMALGMRLADHVGGGA